MTIKKLQDWQDGGKYVRLHNYGKAEQCINLN